MSELEYRDDSYLDVVGDMRSRPKESIDKNANFIYEGKQVKLTGRKATKRIKTGESEKIDTIYEIKGIDGVDWTHWIRLRDLYTIEEF